MNGMPPLRCGMSQKRWSDAFCEAYNALCLQVEAGESTYINHYAATSPAEFYAVLSEYFFTAPDILKKFCPDVHEQLTLFYQQPVSH
jgi:Mlc titration factor MtfA (ptsG expression regulator)